MNQQQSRTDSVNLPPLLRLALSKGNADSVLLHFDRGIAVDCFDVNGRTPLMIAAAGGHTKLCLLLLEKGANPSLTDNSGATASALSRMNGHAALAEALNAAPVRATSDEAVHVSNVDFPSPDYDMLLLADGDDLLGWAREAEASTITADFEVLPVNQLLQSNISFFRPEVVQDAWSEVQISLPSWTVKSRLPESVRRLLPLCVANVQVPLSRLKVAWPEATPEQLRLLVLSLEVAGIRVIRPGADAVYVRAVFRARPTLQDRSVATDIEEYLETLIEEAAPGRIYGQQIDKAGIIDRALEQRIFSGFAESHHFMLLAFQNCEHVIGWLERQLNVAVSPTDHLAVPDGETDDEDVEGEGADNSAYRAQIENILELLEAPGKITREQAGQAHTTSRLIAALERALLRVSADSESASVALRAIRKYYATRDRIFSYGLRFLELAAGAFSGQFSRNDLIQEGTFGLIRAIERFNPAFGHRFQTYASSWIRQSMGRAVDDYSRMVRVPVHVCEAVRKIEKFVRTAISETGEQPGSTEIAEATEIPEHKVRLLQSVPSIRASQRKLRLLPGSEPLPDYQAERIVEAKMIEKTIGRTLLTFDARAERVLRMRFGIGLPVDFTLEEVGEYFGVTRERIRQIEAKALRRLYQYRVRFNLPRRLGDLI